MVRSDQCEAANVVSEPLTGWACEVSDGVRTAAHIPKQMHGLKDLLTDLLTRTWETALVAAVEAASGFALIGRTCSKNNIVDESRSDMILPLYRLVVN